MAKVTVRLTRTGPRQLRELPAVQADLAARANRIAAAAGPGMEVDSHITGGRGRARASVRTATWQARLAESRGRALTRALGSGR